MDSPPRRRTLILLAVVAVVAVVIVAVGVYGLIRGPGASPAPSASSGPSVTSSPVTGTSAPLTTVAAARDPVTYAARVAEALFTWDTSSRHTRADYLQVIFDEADPSGEEAAGLVADLERYYPTAAQWQKLTEYGTAQQLSIDTAVVPDSWAQIARDNADTLQEGTTAVTIRGTRHRTGTWDSQPAQADHDVAFTVFVACPAGKDCTLLRLSGLGTPLE